MHKDVFNKQVIPLFVLSLIVATVGVLVGFYVPPILFLPIVIAEFILLFMTFAFKKKKHVSKAILFGFVFLSGITTTPIVAWAQVAGGAALIFEALAITTISFAALAGYVYTTGKDFRSWGSFLMASLIGLIIASVFNIFMGNSLIDLFIDVGVLVIFLGFVMYDMSRILRNYSDNDVVDAVLALYLDFINIFVRVLQLLGSRRD